jgi:NADPH-dependent ferric siderophore reductase
MRIVFGGPELDDFDSPAPDDHVKLIFPDANGELVVPESTDAGLKVPEGYERPEMRNYTPRYFDTLSQTVTIDFVLHGHGVASTWAAQAVPGQWIAAGGPKSSRVVTDDFDWYLLVGDETALPAIARRIEQTRSDASVTALIEVPSASDCLSFGYRCSLDLQWLIRDDPDRVPGSLLEPALAQVTPQSTDVFAFGATEKATSKRIKKVFLEHFGADDDHIKVSGYWSL